MFTTVRYFIKTSIIFLIVGILSGLYLIISKYYFVQGYNTEIISAHTHIVLVGSVIMMIMGVALWFFPRAEKTDKRYNPDLIRFVFWLMAISTAIRFVAQVINSFLFAGWLNLTVTVASALQVTSIILFFYSIWGRIRPVGSHLREKKGEKF